MSQTYIFHDQAGTIPGIPGTFSHCQVEVDDEGNIRIYDAKGERYLGAEIPIIESTIEPVAEVIPQEPPAMPIEQLIQEQLIQEQPVQEVVPEPENNNQEA